jgi:hypothetical protein
VKKKLVKPEKIKSLIELTRLENNKNIYNKQSIIILKKGE